MKLKRANEFFGYGLFTVGALKILLIIFVLIRFMSNLSTIFGGGDINTNYNLTFSWIIAIAQVILGFGSIVMIIINAKKQPEVITGYLWGLGAVLIEIITPSILAIYVSIVECGMYIKAGNKILSKCNVRGYYKEGSKVTKQIIKDTDWFYSEQDEQKNERKAIQEEKRKAKLEREICEWKQLLDSGEIDEETYNVETNRLIEKANRRNK